MIVRPIFLFYAMLMGLAFAQEANFVYDDHGKRDPFSPLVSPSGVLIDDDADLSISDLNLEGIISDTGGNNLAIVNGKVVKVLDQIGPYQIQAITSNQVRLLKDKQEFTLNLKKGGA